MLLLLLFFVLIFKAAIFFVNVFVIVVGFGKILFPGGLPPVRSRHAAPPKSNQPFEHPQHLQHILTQADSSDEKQDRSGKDTGCKWLRSG